VGYVLLLNLIKKKIGANNLVRLKASISSTSLVLVICCLVFGISTIVRESGGNR